MDTIQSPLRTDWRASILKGVLWTLRLRVDKTITGPHDPEAFVTTKSQLKAWIRHVRRKRDGFHRQWRYRKEGNYNPTSAPPPPPTDPRPCRSTPASGATDNRLLPYRDMTPTSKSFLKRKKESCHFLSGSAKKNYSAPEGLGVIIRQSCSWVPSTGTGTRTGTQVLTRRYGYGYQAGLKYGYGYGYNEMGMGTSTGTKPCWNTGTGTTMGTRVQVPILEWVWVRVRVLAYISAICHKWNSKSTLDHSTIDWLKWIKTFLVVQVATKVAQFCMISNVW